MKRTFKREERLKNNLHIQDLLKHGHTLSSYPLKIYWKSTVDPSQKYPVRIAVAVPRKKFHRAVDRNILKRRIRESYRKHKHVLYEKMSDSSLKILLMVLYISDESIPYEDIDTALLSAMSKLVNDLEK
jgi:ribonuclease P protein component